MTPRAAQRNGPFLHRRARHARLTDAGAREPATDLRRRCPHRYTGWCLSQRSTRVRGFHPDPPTLGLDSAAVLDTPVPGKGTTMKRALLLASLAALCGGLVATTGCTATSSVRCWFTNCISYDQYLS